MVTPEGTRKQSLLIKNSANILLWRCYVGFHVEVRIYSTFKQSTFNSYQKLWSNIYKILKRLTYSLLSNNTLSTADILVSQNNMKPANLDSNVIFGIYDFISWFRKVTQEPKKLFSQKIDSELQNFVSPQVTYRRLRPVSFFVIKA